jgi:hypothetical protein
VAGEGEKRWLVCRREQRRRLLCLLVFGGDGAEDQFRRRLIRGKGVEDTWSMKDKGGSRQLSYRLGCLGRRVRGPVLKTHSRLEPRHLISCTKISKGGKR